MKTELIVHKGVHVKKSMLHGWGVFTSSKIKKGDIVEECIIPYDMIPTNTNAQINYRFIWPDISFKAAKELGVDVQFSGYCLPLGFGAIYNHSKDSNVDWDIDLSERVVQFVAVKDIKAGEELLFNYESPLVNH